MTLETDPANPTGPRIFVPTKSATMFVLEKNCAEFFGQRNDVITIYPGR
jgi:hypothetical protein